MSALGDRLALLLQEFRNWDPAEGCPTTAHELAKKYSLELETVMRIARSEGFTLEKGTPVALEKTVSLDPGYDPDEIPKGSHIGRYELLEKLGEGGMGVVYVAYDPTLNRRIAIKVLRSDISELSNESPAAARRRILREAQSMAQVSNHPNIVPVYDVGTYGERVFIAMEYVIGRPINDYIETYRLGWRQIRRLYLDAAQGLRAAHDAGLVHRDFKPDNVLVDNEMRVRVMDFGLARQMECSNKSMVDKTVVDTHIPLEHNLTATGQIMGTPAYMAPEQFLLEKVDARADQFAFCVAMFEALTGYRPYQATSFRELARKVLNDRRVEPPRKTEVPEWVFDTLMKGLSTNKTDRWASMKDLCEALVEEPPHIKQAVRNNFKKVVAAVGLTTGLLAAGAHFWMTNRANKEIPGDVIPSEPQGMEISKTLLSKKVIHSTIYRQSEDVRDCYRNLLEQNPEAIGRVLLRFTIEMDGRVSMAKVLDNTLPDARMSDCVEASTMFWRFPRTNTLTGTRVVYPFIFTPPQPG